MTVKTLMKRLSSMDPNSEVLVPIGEDSRDNIVWGFISGVHEKSVGDLNDEKVSMSYGDDDVVTILQFEE